MGKKGVIQTRKSVCGKAANPEFIKIRKKFLLDIAMLTRLKYFVAGDSYFHR